MKDTAGLRGMTLVPAATLSLIFFCLYVITLYGSYDVVDTPELMTAGMTLGVAHPPGYVLTSMLDRLLACIPVGGPEFRMNLGAAVAGALAGGLLFALTWVDMMTLSDKIRQIELDKLRMELESREVSPWERIAEKLLENDALLIALTGLIKKTAPAAPRVISAPNNESNVIDRLNNIGFSSTDIENMASYLEENPSVIDQIKPIFTK
jgi:hypothetical protein